MQSEVFLAALAAANTAMKEQEQRNKRRSFHDMGNVKFQLLNILHH